jgi:hypothetical protein
MLPSISLSGIALVLLIAGLAYLLHQRVVNPYRSYIFYKKLLC